MTRKPAVPTLVPGRDDWPPWAEELHGAVSRFAGETGTGAVFVGANSSYAEYFVGQRRKPWQKGGVPRVLVLWAAEPLDPEMLHDWRSALVEESGIEYRILHTPSFARTREKWDEWLRGQLGTWGGPMLAEEAVGLVVGSRVSHQPADGQAYDPAMLMVPPSGTMVDVLARLDQCKREFRKAINAKIKGKVGERRQQVFAALNRLYAFDARRAADDVAEISGEVNRMIQLQGLLLDRRQLPRVLLLGPSGSGKTHVARYLAWRTSVNRAGEGLSRPFKRVPVPEYLGKEDMFEYDVFGYTAGAYTGGRTGGSKGFLAERMGGVVFFDEIGDASPQIQAKLLAYLDDYLVSPRGWEGEPFFCPMLVVAATNRPILEWASGGVGEDTSGGRFRNDLLQRFNHIIRLPSLNMRREELDYLLDMLLQQDAFNPNCRIQRVGERALTALRNLDFDSGNFRTLETVIRQGCATAAGAGRDYLVEDDITSQGFAARTARGPEAPAEIHAVNSQAGPVAREP